MKTRSLRPSLLNVIFYVSISLVVILSGCKSDELKNQITLLTSQQVLAANERDSLLKLLDTQKSGYDTLAADYNSLSDQNKALLKRIGSLQGGIKSRNDQIAKAAEEKTQLNNVIAARTAGNDSLRQVVVTLQDQITGFKGNIAEAQDKNQSLIGQIEQKNQRIAADSVAEAERLAIPKDFGFVDIAGIAGGFGLGITNNDYSERVITVDNIFGYQINKKFLAGIGTGVHFYNGGTLVPVFLDMRYVFNQKDIRPFFSADGGALFNFTDWDVTNIFVCPAFGLSKKVGSATSLNLSLGYLVMNAPNAVRSSFITIKGAVSFLGKNGPRN